jgi:simple sugar transport system permease protein
MIIAGLMAALGVSPLRAYGSILRGAFGSPVNLADTIAKTIPIALIGLGIALTFRCGLWNIGGEGQLYFGAIAALVVGVEFTGPAYLVIPAATAAGIVAGSLAGLVPAVLRVRFHASEILVTLMLNFIAVLLAGFIIAGPYSHPVVPATIPIGEAAQLPAWSIGGLRLHGGVIWLAVLTAAIGFIMSRTTYGSRIRMIGTSEDAARNAGIGVSRIRVTSFLIAGGLAGLAGMIQLSAVSRSLVDGFSPGFGFSAIIAALLGQLRPLPTVLASFGLSALLVGAQAMQRAEGIQMSLVNVIQGLLLLLLLGAGVVGKGLIRK